MPKQMVWPSADGTLQLINIPEESVNATNLNNHPCSQQNNYKLIVIILHVSKNSTFKRNKSETHCVGNGYDLNRDTRQCCYILLLDQRYHLHSLK